MFKIGKSLSSQYEQLKSFAGHLKSQCIRHRDQTRDMKGIVDELLPLLVEAESRMSSVSTEMVIYAQQQESSPLYDASVEITTLSETVTTLRVWLTTNLPVAAGGTVKERVLNADGSTTAVALTSSQISAIVARVQTIIDTIE